MQGDRQTSRSLVLNIPTESLYCTYLLGIRGGYQVSRDPCYDGDRNATFTLERMTVTVVLKLLSFSTLALFWARMIFGGKHSQSFLDTLAQLSLQQSRIYSRFHMIPNTLSVVTTRHVAGCGNKSELIPSYLYRDWWVFLHVYRSIYRGQITRHSEFC